MRTKTILMALAAGAATLAAAGCGGGKPAAAPETRSAVTLAIATAAPSEIAATFEATGAIAPRKRVSPGTKIMGRVESVKVREGDRVAAGDVLASLEKRDLLAAVEQAKAAVAMASARLDNAAAQHRRIEDLHARGSVTDKNLEDATAGWRVAEAGLEQAEANLDAANVMLGYADVVAPVAGWVTAKRIESGDMAAPGMPLFTVEDLGRVKVVVNVPEAAVVGLERGETATVVVDVLGLEREARIERINPAGDPMSRTYEVELSLDNAEARLKSGMFARARFDRGSRKALLVPPGAVVDRGQLRGVFVVGDDGVARLRWIRTGRRDAGGVEVLSGLEAGERYVVAPPPGLADATPVVEG